MISHRRRVTRMTTPVDDRLLKEAEGWFARRLDPSVRDAEQAEFERWRADPKRGEAYAEAERLWERLAVLKQSQRLRDLVPESTTLVSRAAWRRHPAVLALAATFAAVAVLTVLWLNRGAPVQTY